MPRESSASSGDDVRQLRGRAVSTESKTPDQHICADCNKRFASAASLESHKRVHAMKPTGGETTQKRRAVAPATAPEPKKARVQVQRYDDPEDAGIATRSGGTYRPVYKCKLCSETFEEREEWINHTTQRHPQKTTSSGQEGAAAGGEEDARKSPYPSQHLTPSKATTPGSATRQQASTQLQTTPTTSERQFNLRSPTSAAVGSPGSTGSHARSRNTTLRFEEELTDGQVQCRQCQQVFNNRRGLAAHVAQKHREELDQEQRVIEEEKIRKEEIFQRRRRDASRLIQSGIPQLITPPSRPISILTRRAPGSALQQRGPTILRVADAPPAATQTVIYPQRATLEILTQPAPVSAAASSNQQQTNSSAQLSNKKSLAVRPDTRGSQHESTTQRREDPPTGAYAEALPDPILSPREKGRTGDRPRLEDIEDDEMIDESAYEFSTEVTVAAVSSQQEGDSGAKSPIRSRKSRQGASAGREYASDRGAAESPSDHELESYPCRFCKDRVFLTSYGLERHTKMSHPGQLEEVLDDIRQIQLEKGRRPDAGASRRDEPLFIDEGRGRSYERFPHLDARHQIPGLGTAAAQSASYMKRRQPDLDKENEPSDDTGELIQMAREQTAALVAGASFTENRFNNRARRQNDVARAKYQSCDICGILINTEHPRALESHTKAHQKNQELRDELMRKFGAAWVERVTCRECNLVFKDEDKLEQHRRNVHVRRRHFLCRFCGDVFRNMRDLNLHKERRHEAFEGHRRQGESTPPPRRAAHSARRGGDTARSPDMAVAVEEFACRSTCEVCGLHMVRPSNLIRHMKLAHNRTNFTATVETRGMPAFKIDVNDGVFMWGCCDEVFDDRQAFINHRRVAHGPSYATGNPKECEHCGLTFKNNLAYNHHLRSHRPRVCNICGESFGNSVVDLNAFRAHMIRHREQGYTIRLPPIEEELATKEQQELWKAINDEEADDGSEDEYSVYSESGVESDIEDDSASDDDDAPPDQMTCPMCEKTFSCIYRYCDHWKLHCRQPFRNGLTTTLKTKPFSYKTRRPAGKFKCRFCPKRFNIGETLIVHSARCGLRKRGILPNEEADISGGISSSGASSKTSSPLKLSQAKSLSGVGELARESIKQSATVAGVEEEKRKEVDDDNESMKELEDQLDVTPKKKKFVPDYIEKAYIVEWDTNKPPNEQPYVCQNCHQSFGDFLSLIMHVKSHIAHPITEDDEEGEEKTAAADKENNESDTPADEKSGENGEESANKKKKDEKVTVSILRIRTSTAEALGKYSCQVCGRCYHDQKALDSHLDEAHRPRKRHRCNLCRRHFWTSAGLRKHQLSRHDITGRIHACGVCGKKFSTLFALNAHESRHELTNSLYQCEDCTVSFYGLRQLKQHFNEHHEGVTILSCPVCARIHTDQKSLDDHFDNDHAAVRTLCRVCKKVFHTPMQARQHRHRVHMADGKTTESCTLCGKLYFDKRQLALHTWRHLSTKSHQCRVCDRPFENDEEVRTHLEQEHQIGWLDSRDMILRNSTVFSSGAVGGGGGTEKETEIAAAAEDQQCFSCHVCSKKFNTKAAVKEHLEQGVHQRNKKRKCGTCGMKFLTISNLAKHMHRRHQQEMEEDQSGQENMALDQNQALLLDQSQLRNLQYMSGGENVQVIVADDSMTASGGDQEYQVLLVQNENGETIQLALGPQAQLELAQLQHQPASTAGTSEGAETQPMEIDESNYQQFLNN